MIIQESSINAGWQNFEVLLVIQSRIYNDSVNSKKNQTKSPNGWGGARPGAGRPKGQGPIRVSAAEALKLAAEGETPLAYMLRVMRENDDDIDTMLANEEITELQAWQAKQDRQKRRDWAAQASAPYIHPKLSSVDVTTDDTDKDASDIEKLLSLLEDEELESIQQLLLDASLREGSTAKPN